MSIVTAIPKELKEEQLLQDKIVSLHKIRKTINNTHFEGIDSLLGALTICTTSSVKFF